MNSIFKFGLFVVLFLYGPSCTVYTEKQTEALSKVVYASKDSINAARIDLADQYITEATRIVKPPKQRIEIQSVYKKETTNTKDKPTILVSEKRVVIIPEKYKQDLVIVVGSEEYQKLLADKETYEQIKKDNDELLEAKKTVDDELIRQSEFRDKMVKDLNVMQRKIAEKDLIILHRDIMIVCLLATFGAGIYFKLKGII